MQSRRINSIDTLRGLAILGVVVVHSAHAVEGLLYQVLALGRFGVQLFFFVSAYSMCHMWDQRAQEPNRTSNFYLRRAVRIAPLFWLAIPVYVLWQGGSLAWWSAEGRGIGQVLVSAVFLHGFFPDIIGGPVVYGGWSIAAEMMFYLLFPLIALRVRTHWLLAGAVGTYFGYLLAVRPALEVALTPAYGATLTHEFLYFNFLNQLPVFLLGCFLYRHRSIGRSTVKLLALVFPVWLAAAAAVHIADRSQAWGFLGMVLVLFVLVYQFQRRGWSWAPMSALGKLSYGIYIAHFIVVSAVESAFTRSGPLSQGFPNFVAVLIVGGGVSYVIALVLFRFIESPVTAAVSRWIAVRNTCTPAPCPDSCTPPATPAP